MWKLGMAALAAAAVFSPCLAQADEFEDGMNTMWEVLWHQSGVPTRLVRWDQDIQVRIQGVNAAGHRKLALQALRDAAAEAGVKVVDVSDRPDAAQVANVDIEITPDSGLQDRVTKAVDPIDVGHFSVDGLCHNGWRRCRAPCRSACRGGSPR